MPRKRFQRRRPRRGTRRFHKRSFRRHHKRNELKTTRIKGISCLPDRLFVKLKYFELGLILLNANNRTNCFFRGNGAYDPNGFLGGHSPLGYDQWSALYSNYRVHKSSIFLKAVYSTGPIRVSCTPSTINNSPNSVYAAMEAPRTKYFTIMDTANPRHYLKDSAMSKAIFGVKSISYEDAFSAPTNNVPIDQWSWVINTTSFDGVTNETCRVDIHMVYWIEFFNRVELQSSGFTINPFGQTGNYYQDVTTSTITGVTGSGGEGYQDLN